MIVISDSSPLIALSSIRRLDLIRELYGPVLIPEAVYREIARDPAAQGHAQEIDAAEWIEVRSVSNRQIVYLLARDIDQGEAEALSLALETQADLLLLDDRKARRAAAGLGLRVVGVAGILLEGKARGLIPLVKPLLDQMSASVAFRLKDSLYESILRMAGE